MVNVSIYISLPLEHKFLIATNYILSNPIMSMVNI